VSAERYRSLTCDDGARRALVRADDALNGIDYVEVVTAPPADDQLLLEVYFIAKETQDGRDGLSNMLDRLDGAPGRVNVEGGVRIRPVEVVSVARVGDHLEVRVDEPGDYSDYTLEIRDSALDPAYSRCNFNFKAGCPSRFDCEPRQDCPPEVGPEPPIDYMAKDYASFRRALIDLIPTLAPQWAERHEADLGIALVELLAYVGDQLSYYQDAVANEAYLETARQRLSVRRHARLIDYRMHDGASARAFVQCGVSAAGRLPSGTSFLSRVTEPLGPTMTPPGPFIPPESAGQALQAAGTIFESMQDAHLHRDLNEVEIHTWGNRQCCLPRGTTTVDLVGDLAADPSDAAPAPWKLRRGCFLLFEEVAGPENGLPSDADPAHRQVVRLTSAEWTQDSLLKLDLTRITWDRADALKFPLCLSARLANGTYIPRVSVARGNLVLADHGRTIRDETHEGPEKPAHPSQRRAHRFPLDEGPLSFRLPVPEANGPVAPVEELLVADPGRAKPQVTRLRIGTAGRDWKPVAPDLLASGPFDPHFVVETGNDARAQLRFGDGQYGMAPPEEGESAPGESAIRVTYRVGVGRSGNVGADSLVHVVAPEGPLPLDWPGIAPVDAALPKPVRNPLAAWGGIDPEPIEEVKQLAPAAFRAEQLRAVTEEDYARVAEKHREVSRAIATFRWTGSWHTVFVSVDPVGRTDMPRDLEDRIRDWISRFTQAGYDLEIDPPIFVPLEVWIDVCVAPDHFRADVEEALLEALGNRGFFHPDNFTFGQALHLSRLYAAVERVEGVDSALITRFQRFGLVADGELEQGSITMGRLEIVRLDNDPSFPENGVLQLNMMGGR
jgi:hypothetical protein